jgi:glycosyltransferase involved in cell wall biosynthesis
MACGVPAVASNVGGVPELITDSVDGVLCPVGDIDAMAQACRDLLTDSECYKSVAGAARETALTRFCATKIIPLYEDYYREIRATPAT